MPVDGEEPICQGSHEPCLTQTGVHLLFRADTLFNAVGGIVVDDIVGLGDDVIQTAPAILYRSALLVLVHRSLGVILVGLGIGIEEIVGTGIAQIHEAALVEIIPGLGVEACRSGLKGLYRRQLLVGRNHLLVFGVEVSLAAAEEEEECEDSQEEGTDVGD